MSRPTVNKTQGKDESDDDFQYEEVCLEDDRSFIEGEEDLEATVKAIKEASAAASRANTTSTTDIPEAVDYFLRSFLFQMGMTETLDCYQAEWTELVEKGLVDTRRVGVVPEVYTENRRLESALKNAQREREEYSKAGSSAAETLQRVQKARDLHRLQHKRVVQEKSRLIEEMKKLKGQCKNYEPEVKRMNEKYKAVLKQTMQVSLEREKLKSAQHNTPHCGDAGEEGELKKVGVKGTTHHVIQPKPPSSAESKAGSPRRANIC